LSFHPQLFLPGTNFLPGIKNSSLSEPSGSRLRTTASEGLNSSLAQSAAQLWLAEFCPERANYTFFETFSVLSKTGFWIIILAPNMLESQSRALKTRNLG